MTKLSENISVVCCFVADNIFRNFAGGVTKVLHNFAGGVPNFARGYQSFLPATTRKYIISLGGYIISLGPGAGTPTIRFISSAEERFYSLIQPFVPLTIPFVSLVLHGNGVWCWYIQGA